MTDALGNVTRFSYDLAGNQTEVIDASGHVTTFEYDVLNRLTKTTFHDGTYTETFYDSLGRRIAERDQDGRIKEFAYDGLGRLVEVTEFLEYSSPDNPVRNDSAKVVKTSYNYDEVGNRIAQIDAKGNTTRYQYDELGRRTARILPDGAIETYAYDNVGNMLTKTDFSGQTTTYTYDSMNRLVEELADPSHPSLVLAHALASYTYTYDNIGNQTSAIVYAVDDSILYEEHYTFDERNRLVEAETSYGVLTYTYDAANNLLSVSSDNQDGLDLEYGYDVLNRLQTVKDHGAAQPPLEHAYSYDAVGNLESFTLANGVKHEWNYDTLNRLTNLSITDTVSSTILRSFTYGLSDAGLRESITENTGRISAYTYDGLNRLTNETITGDPDGLNGSVEYAYDKVGNRLGVLSTLGGVDDVTLDYDLNDRITAHTSDSNGNTWFADGHTDIYDFRNRLIRRIKNDGTVIDLVYSAAGDRISKTVDGVAEYYLTDRNNLTGYSQVAEILAEDSQTGILTPIVVNSYGLDMIGTTKYDEVNGWQSRYFGYDGIGSVTITVDEQAVVINSYTYSAYGELLSGTLDDFSINYLYTGELFDVKLGMYFLRARHYSPEYGRFWTMDTYEGNATDPVTLHKYLYGNGSPVMYVDPSGRFSLASLSTTSSVIGILQRIAVPGIVAGLNIAVQARLYTVLKPLADELNTLANELYVLSPSSASTLSALADETYKRISLGRMAFEVALPTGFAAVGGKIGGVGGVSLAILRAYALESFASQLIEKAATGVSYDGSIGYFSFSGSLKGRTSLLRIFTGQLNPANDLRHLTDFIISWKNVDPVGVGQNFYALGQSLAEYGDFNGQFGFRTGFVQGKVGVATQNGNTGFGAVLSGQF